MTQIPTTEPDHNERYIISDHPMARFRAVNLHRNEHHRLEGPCPWCSAILTISVDVFYDRFTGSCPECREGVAYRAPDGTFRSNVVDPSTDIWRIDHYHYCADCRHEISSCTCAPAKRLPAGYKTPDKPPWLIHSERHHFVVARQNEPTKPDPANPTQALANHGLIALYRQFLADTYAPDWTGSIRHSLGIQQQFSYWLTDRLHRHRHHLPAAHDHYSEREQHDLDTLRELWTDATKHLKN